MKRDERWYGGLVRRSKIQTRQSLSVLYCGIFHSQNIFCALVYNVMWSGIQCFQCYNLSVVSKKQNNANSTCIIGNCLLFQKPFKAIPPQLFQHTTYQLMSQCCRPLPRNPPHCFCTAITFVCVHVYYWTGDWCWLVVMKCVVIVITEWNTVI